MARGERHAGQNSWRERVPSSSLLAEQEQERELSSRSPMGEE